MSRAGIYFDVAPRYTGGSPAQVPQAIAERVAGEELDGFRMTLAGVYGEAAVARAQQLGVEGIAEERRERGDGWEIRDLISDRRFFRIVRRIESDRQWLARVERARRQYRSSGRIVQAIDRQAARAAADRAFDRGVVRGQTIARKAGI